MLAQKRSADTLSVYQETKRVRNELSVYTAKDKALAASVSIKT